LIVELPDNTLNGSGFVNLRNESVGLAFCTRRKSLFDWSAISIARFIEVSGILTASEINMYPYELTRQGALTASSVVWGPLPAFVYSMAESGLKNRASRECFRSID